MNQSQNEIPDINVDFTHGLSANVVLLFKYVENLYLRNLVTHEEYRQFFFNWSCQFLNLSEYAHGKYESLGEAIRAIDAGHQKQNGSNTKVLARKHTGAGSDRRIKRRPVRRSSTPNSKTSQKNRKAKKVGTALQA